MADKPFHLDRANNNKRNQGVSLNQTYPQFKKTKNKIMEIKLIDGRFTIDEAEKLLTAIFQTKIAFHEQKIRTIHHTEEDIKQSEKRIMQLEENLREAIRKMKSKV